MSDAPIMRAAFINAIADEGTKEEAVEWLQKTWDEKCQLERQNAELRKQLEQAEARSRWTSVKAGNPKERGTYLVYQSGQIRIMNYGARTKWDNGRDRLRGDCHRVTYWTSLPPPPAEQKEPE